MTTSSLAAQRGIQPATVALVLALLSVPGVVLTWDLPAGGFWTGVPLAIGAVVLGVRARPDGRATAAIVIGAVALLFVAAWTIASAV